MNIGGQVGGREVGSLQIHRNRKTGRQVGGREILHTDYKIGGHSEVDNQSVGRYQGIGRQVDGRQVGSRQILSRR